MNAVVKAPEPSYYEIRAATKNDLIAMTEPGGLGEQFFHESEFKQFTTYDPMKLRDMLIRTTATGDMVVLTAYCQGELVGGIAFNICSHYTVEPMAMLFLFFVTRRRRLTPLGKALMQAAEAVAKNLGAVVFYAGATANMPGSTDRRMMNMLDKLGYDRLGGVCRKLLERIDE